MMKGFDPLAMDDVTLVPLVIDGFRVVGTIAGEERQTETGRLPIPNLERSFPPGFRVIKAQVRSESLTRVIPEHLPPPYPMTVMFELYPQVGRIAMANAAVEAPGIERFPIGTEAIIHPGDFPIGRQ